MNKKKKTKKNFYLNEKSNYKVKKIRVKFVQNRSGILFYFFVSLLLKEIENRMHKINCLIFCDLMLIFIVL